MNRQQVLQAVIFLTVLVSLLYGIQKYVEWGVRWNTYGESGKINKLMKHRIDPEVMIFGSSVALVQLDDSLIAAETGLSTFNMGLSGVSFQQYEGLVREFALYSTQCKYVVLANTPFELIPRNLLYEPYNFYAHLGKKNIYRTLVKIDPAHVKKMRYLPFYPLIIYDRHFYNLSREGHKERKGDKPPAPKPDGFLPVHDFRFNDESLKGVKDDSLDVPLNDMLIQKFSEVIRLLNDKGITVILLSPPVEREMCDKLKNEEKLAAVWNRMAGEENYFLDYTRHPIGQKRSNFYNYTHLNSKGAALFSHVFAHELNLIVKSAGTQKPSASPGKKTKEF